MTPRPTHQPLLSHAGSHFQELPRDSGPLPPGWLIFSIDLTVTSIPTLGPIRSLMVIRPGKAQP